MSRHHELANMFYEEHTIMLDCSLCYEVFKKDVPHGNSRDRLEAAKDAHKEGWRLYFSKQAEYEGQEVTINGCVCPNCNNKIKK